MGGLNMKNTILVDKYLDTGEFKIHFHPVDERDVYLIDSCYSEEAVHASIIDIVHNNIGKSLSGKDKILFSEFDYYEGEVLTWTNIYIIDYLENI